MKWIFLICVSLLSFAAKSQFLDTLTAAIHQQPSIDARLESRYSIIHNDAAKVSGVRLGIVFKRKLRLGGGYSWLATKNYENKLITNSFGKPEMVKDYLKFGYLCYYVDFVFHKTKRWQLSVPIQVGAGLSHFEYTEASGIKIKSRNYFLLIYEPGITVQFKITRWAGLGCDVAYRFGVKNTKFIGQALNSPTISVKYLIWFDQIFFLAFPKSKITQKYGPATW